MSGLRDFITGSDACTTGDGAGPSNAAASLAETLLGGRSKQQAQLHELPGRQLPSAGPSIAPFQPPTAAQAADAALHSELPSIPGLTPSFRPQGLVQPGDVDAYLRSLEAPGGPQDRMLAEFESIYGQQQQQQFRPPQQFQHPDQAVVAPLFQAFFNSSKAQLPFQPTLPQHTNLSVIDKCRIRDRSTILARHVFADRGNVFADEQVSHLLSSLSINPAELPSTVDTAAWDKIYAQGPANAAATDHAAASHMANQQQQQQHPQWVEEFENMRLKQNEFSNSTNSWVDEFKATAEAGSMARAAARDGAGDAIQQTKKLADTLAANQDPKFQNSKFLQFVSKMSRGEIIMEDNQAKEVPRQAAEWVGEFSSSQQGMPSMWGDEFASFQANQHPHLNGGGVDWADEFANGLTGGTSNAWAEEFSANPPTSSDIANWEEEYLRELEHLNSAMGPRSAGEYIMSDDNPFLLDIDSYSTGKELFRKGLLTEAVLALEAECQRNPNNSEAWRLLGTVQAENDDDRQAIAAMNRALAADPDNLEVLLSLGVSHTNELDQTEALNFLRQWLLRHHVYGAEAKQMPPPLDSSQALSNTIQLFASTSRHHAQDADVHVALGVLCNLSRQYDDAIQAFQSALKLRPSDYSLWNKLGATLANSGRSAEAINSYKRALELKPNYMRAWTNMGISLANIGDYQGSAAYYVRALSLNPQASAVWSYLQTTLVCLGALADYSSVIDGRDVKTLATAFPL